MLPHDDKIETSSAAEVAKNLKSSYPGRETQIDVLLGLLGGPYDAIPPLLVHGGSGLGKSSIVRAALRQLSRPHAVLSCRALPSPRLLFEAALNQLAGHVREASNNYASYKHCETSGDFVKLLPDAVALATARQHQKLPTGSCKLTAAKSEVTVKETNLMATAGMEAAGKGLNPSDSWQNSSNLPVTRETSENGTGAKGSLEQRGSAAAEARLEMRAEKKEKEVMEGSPPRRITRAAAREMRSAESSKDQEGPVLHVKPSRSKKPGQQKSQPSIPAPEVVPSTSAPPQGAPSFPTLTGEKDRAALNPNTEHCSSSSPADVHSKMTPVTPSTQALLAPHKIPLAPECMPPAKSLSPCAPVDVPPVVYLVFDDAQLLRESEWGRALLPAVPQLAELARVPQLGIILVSTLGWASFRCQTGSREPVPLLFPGYEERQLAQVLKLQYPDNPIYDGFLKAVLGMFVRADRQLTSLSATLAPLWERYYEPVKRGVVDPHAPSCHRQLYQLLRPHIQHHLAEPFLVAGAPAGVQRDAGGERQLDFEMGKRSKYLLLAAYVASRNPPTLDEEVLDLGNGRKRRRKSTASSQEKAERSAREMHLKGPAPFPLERLLDIYASILANEGCNADYSTAAGSAGPQGSGSGEIDSDVLIQVSTLVQSNFLAQAAGDPLEGPGVKYRCRVDQDLIRQIARSVQCPLERYLLHG